MDPGPAYRRRRPAVACTECRRRKIRCDRHSPCGPCSKSVPSLQCVYNNHPTNRGSVSMDQPAMHMQQHESLGSLGVSHAHSDSHEQLMDLFNLDMAPMSDHVPIEFVDMDFFDLAEVSHSKSTSTESFSSLPHGSASSSSWTTSSLPSTMNGSSSTSMQSLLYPSETVQSRGLVSQGEERDYTEFNDQRNDWYLPFSQCRKLNFLAESLASENISPSPDTESVRPLFEKFKRLKRTVEEHHGNKNLIDNWTTAQTAAWDVLPPRSTCDALLDSYIRTFESVLRIFHVPSFLRDYEHFWETSTSPSGDIDDTFACKLLLAIALGSTTLVPTESHPDQFPSLGEQASRWILYVKEWLARQTVKGMRADLSMAQIACLLALTRHTHSQDVAPIGVGWLSGGHDLTHIAVQLGLHREPRVRTPNMSAKEAEIRRRLWATMLELSLQVAIDKGLPAPIAPESYDCEPPSNIADSDLYLGVEPQGVTSASVLPLLAQTQRLRLRILQLANAPGSSKTYPECHSLAAELNTACFTGLETLRSTYQTPPSDFQIKLVDFFTRPFVLALHEPFAEQASTKPEYYYSRRMRMEISAQLLTPTKDHHAYAALLAQGHGHFQFVHRKATMSLCLDLIREHEASSFPSLDTSCHRDLLELLSGSVDAFQRRVRATGGAESTSEYMLFSCAAAYLEALQHGYGESDVDEKILAAVKSGLSFCCDVMDLQRRRGSSVMSRCGDAQGASEAGKLWMG
ncbi:hypothetical protein DER45DRAFT_530232 [Fusarium avenaceum]|nr:hypothetical protein DER45DRAFT_530232 [Fusarium avenaceum]